MVRNSFVADAIGNMEVKMDGRGGVTHIEWVGPDGQRMLTFPGDFPPDAEEHAQEGTLYMVKSYDDDDGEIHTNVIIYGKPWDAAVTDPVWRAVIEGGQFKTFERVSAHTGNPAYWNVPPEYRGELLDDVLKEMPT